MEYTLKFITKKRIRLNMILNQTDFILLLKIRFASINLILNGVCTNEIKR
ncbi:MAG: hypothetical protein RR734_04205 [Bacilli bacterium]